MLVCFVAFAISALFLLQSRATGKPDTLEAPREALGAALLAHDLAAVEVAVEWGRKVLGDQAGVPEVADEYLPVPSSARLLSADEVRLSVKKTFAHLQRLKTWRIGLDPTKLAAPLRAPAGVVAGMVAIHRAKLDDGRTALREATEAADFLIWAQEQAGAGCYPFPAARNTSQERAMQVATRFLERAEAAGKLGETVRNGWAYEDHGDGGMQFDNGECGVAIFELFEVTQDQRYLDSALKAADWALKRPLCPNWNYNSFSVNLLAKAHQVTKHPKYLQAALEKALLGVVPGQLTSGPRAGRWMDPHNARPAYHYIMMTALARLASELPKGHTDLPKVLQSIKLGLSARNGEILGQGVMNKDKPVECLNLVQHLFAHDTAFLTETTTGEALDTIQRLASEEARHGKFPLGPRGWGELLERCARQD